LSTEWQFYVLMVLLGRRFGRTPWTLLGLAAVGMAWDVWAPEGWQFSRAFLPNKAAYFALGVASAGLLRSSGGVQRYIVALAAVLVTGWFQGGAGKMLPPLVWTMCLGAEFFPGLPLIGPVLRSRSAQWLGGLSYSLYLANEPVQKLLGVGLALLTNGDGRVFTLWWLPGSVGLPLCAAILLRKWVEIPALLWLRRKPVHLA
jgi:peptidoglycan/LPS O-acetylase OafA/YrhL